MYVIVEKAKLEGKFFGIMNTLPDGRVYIPISEMRNVGTLLDIDIIGSARELKELIEKQQEAMQGTEDIDPGFSVTPGEEEEIDPGFSQEPNPDSDSGFTPLTVRKLKRIVSVAPSVAGACPDSLFAGLRRHSSTAVPPLRSST